MADNEHTQPESLPVYQHVVIGGKPFEIHLAEYFVTQTDKPTIYSMSNPKDTLHLDPATGYLSGSLATEANNSLFSFEISATSLEDASVQKIQLNLIVVAGAEASADEETTPAFNEEDFFKGYSREIHHYIQYIINQHFIFLLAFDGSQSFSEYGKLLSTRQAKSGWMVYEFENCLCINAGELALAEGNRHRYIETLKEFFLHDVAKKGWKSVTLESNTLENISPAWIIGKELNMPITNDPPTIEAAETLMRNQEYDAKRPTPKR